MLAKTTPKLTLPMMITNPPKITIIPAIISMAFIIPFLSCIYLFKILFYILLSVFLLSIA